MLTIIYGVPGSGKSYFAVWNIKKTIEKEKDNIVLISNIENLKLPHLNLDDLIQQYGGIDNFFNVDCEFWKTDIDKKKILFIDECQKYFNKKFFSSTVFFYFQYHRHLNVDIYLITQSYKVLPSELVVLSEIVIQAVPASFRWFRSSFKYLIKDLETGEVVEKIDIPFKKDVAELYTSALVIQDNKKFTYTQKYLFFSILLISVALFLLIFVFPKFFLSSFSKSSSQSPELSESSVSSQSPKPSESSVSSQSSVSSSDDDLKKLFSDGFSYPSDIASKGYVSKKIQYGEFLNKYRNGVVYDLTVNYIIVYDKHNRPADVYIYKELSNPSSEESSNSDNVFENPSSQN
jgi:Zonular occludens toxin (Zot).